MNKTRGQAPFAVQFTDLSIGDPTSWYWQFGDGGVSQVQNPSHVFSLPGTYTISLRAFGDKTGGYGVCNECIEVPG